VAFGPMPVQLVTPAGAAQGMAARPCLGPLASPVTQAGYPLVPPVVQEVSLVAWAAAFQALLLMQWPM
jgi:hypothetical protein